MVEWYGADVPPYHCEYVCVCVSAPGYSHQGPELEHGHHQHIHNTHNTTETTVSDRQKHLKKSEQCDI